MVVRALHHHLRAVVGDDCDLVIVLRHLMNDLRRLHSIAGRNVASVGIPSNAAHCPRLLFVPGQTTVALST